MTAQRPAKVRVERQASTKRSRDLETSPSHARLKFVFRIKDSIHGALHLTQEEGNIADHPYHQRCQGIRQNGLCYFHAPSAVHTRREHMLGVVASVTRMIEALYEGSEKDKSKFEPWETRHTIPSVGVRLHEMPEKYKTWLLRIARLAALVHDVGHGPLSHDFEIFLPLLKDSNAILNDPRLDRIRPLIELWREEHPKELRLSHEIVSCILFALMWADTHPGKMSRADAAVPTVVAAILLGLATNKRTRCLLASLDAVQMELLPLATELVSSAPIDADRIDYLMRDARAMGVDLGRFDLDRILKSVIAVEIDGRIHLGWRLSGLTAIEQFIIARYFMFSEMYGHKTNHAGSLMTKKAHEAHLSGQMPSPLVMLSLVFFVNSFTSLSDELFLRLLAGEFPARLQPPTEIEEIGRRLQERRLWKCVFHDRDTQLQPKTRQDRLKALVDYLRKRFEGVRFYESTRAVRATKDLDKGACLARLVERKGGRRYIVDSARSWLQASDLIELFHRREMALVRIFADLPPGQKSARIKSAALAFLAKYDKQHVHGTV